MFIPKRGDRYFYAIPKKNVMILSFGFTEIVVETDDNIIYLVPTEIAKYYFRKEKTNENEQNKYLSVENRNGMA